MRIYLDHNATSPLRPEVFAAMGSALRDLPGNPSSVHAEGSAARAAVEAARHQVARAIGGLPGQLVFTSGATESNATALASFLAAGSARGRTHVVTSTVEHPSVSAPLARFEASGTKVTRVGVSRDGRIDPDSIVAALRPDTALVALLWANNETGVIQPVEEVAAAARTRGIPVHLDATQCLGRVPVDVDALGIDSLAGSAHKQNGPKGVGFLWLAADASWHPLLCGGPQERGRRGGTENVAGIVGLGVACELAAREQPARSLHAEMLRRRLWDGIASKIPDVQRNGAEAPALPNTLNVCFRGAAADVLLQALDLEGVAVSTGSACHSGSIEPSPVLRAMGIPAEDARASLRFSVGAGVDEAQIDHVLRILPDLVARVRERAT